MSLLESMMERFTLLVKTRTSDGEGGWTVSWTDGASFDAAVTHDSSMQARIAEAQGVTNTYTITTTRGITLDYHDVVRRESDGITFRITSESSEKKSPAFGTLNMAQATCERWRLT